MGHERRTAVIIGAGPAGLTAALEFCRRSDIKPIVLEASNRIGGIACTVQHNGNRMDVGGHRFFSKSDRVMDWWAEIMPVEDEERGGELAIGYHNEEMLVKKTGENARVPAQARDEDCVMLVRRRRSRIYFMRSFFDYPLSLSMGTLRRLGPVRTIRVIWSYAKAQVFKRRPEKTLEDFLINRFGSELYLKFFKSYTEKVWGLPCDQISAAWGAQRIRGLSLVSAARHFLKKVFRLNDRNDLYQKNSETSLIERFLYPKYGPGQLWERVAGLVQSSGGEVRPGWRAEGVHVESRSDGAMYATSVDARTPEGNLVCIRGDFVFSTMPIRELIGAIDAPVPEEIREIADGLMYRDFITVGLLVDRLLLTERDGSTIKDTWIYVQEPDVLVGRIQIYNNWSPYLVSDPSKVWIGLEYFCYDTDVLWKKADEELARFAIEEVARIGILRADEVATPVFSACPKPIRPMLEPTIDSVRWLRT